MTERSLADGGIVLGRFNVVSHLYAILPNGEIARKTVPLGLGLCKKRIHAMTGRANYCHRLRTQFCGGRQNYALGIPNSPLHPKFPHLFRQPLDAVFIFSRQIIHFLHGAIDLSDACHHLLQIAFADRESCYWFGSLPKFATGKLVA
ncbi:MAG: hypothetical protein ACTTKL_08150 [Treponema sp.]